MNTVVRYAALAAFVSTLGFMTMAHFRDSGADGAFQERRAEVTARAVAFVSAQEKALPPEQAGIAQRFTESVQAKVEGLDEALVLKRNKYTTHSDPAKAGERLDRDSLSDKALYDDASRVVADVKKNVEERERNPELKRNAFKEIDVKRNGDRLVVMVPVKIDGKAKSVARVTAANIAVDRPFPLGVVIVGLIGFAVLVGLSFVVRGSLMFPLGTVVTAGLVLAEGVTFTGWSSTIDDAFRDRLGQTYAVLADAGLLEAETDDAKAVPALRETPTGVPDSTLARIEPASAGTGGIEHAGYRVVYDLSAAAAGASKATIAWSIAFGLLACGLFMLGVIGRLDRDLKILWGHREAYAYMASAMAGMLILVMIPVVYGIALGFQKRTYNEFNVVGLANYTSILSDFNVSEPRNFYFTLAVTFLWTVLNVCLHVSIGLFLALLLNDKFLKMRAMFRVVLILPWAVPNYITALIWKGMFHKQFGAINLMLDSLGIGGIAWFQSFWTAFSANVATNTWLGFPFMMVVALGALQSIPPDLYEAAIVDGASRWQRFKSITVPLLMPALVPAVIVGTVWTFNMFNIIYLVSGGEPNGGTDILITDAFRWFFERDRPGYAAAYATIIFVILAVFTTITNRVTGATKGAFE